MSEKTKARIHKINLWCVEQSADFFTNLVRDLKSLKSLWNYLILLLFTWVCCYGVVFYPAICLNTVIITVGGLVGTIFTGYIWAANAEKKAAMTFPAYSNPTKTAAPAGEGDDGNG